MTMLEEAKVDLATMRAPVLEAPGRVSIERIAIPTPGPGDVRVKLLGCGVCGSNLEPWRGNEWMTYPFPPGAPGHEGWGVVDALGDEVQQFQPGDPVALISNRAFAEYDVAPAEYVVRIPRQLADRPMPAEALGCVMNIFHRCDVRPGQTVAILGIGFLGALLTQLCVNTGARVIPFSRRQSALDTARQFGARDGVMLDDHYHVISRAKVLTDGEGFDRVIEATGSQWPLDLAGEFCKTRGKLIIAGYHQDGPRRVNMQQWNWKGLDVINAHEREPMCYVRGMREAIDAILHGHLNPYPLYTHRFRPDQLGQALEMLDTRPDHFMKGLVIHD